MPHTDPTMVRAQPDVDSTWENIWIDLGGEG
jgi:hypothetical protein